MILFWTRLFPFPLHESPSTSPLVCLAWTYCPFLFSLYFFLNNLLYLLPFRFSFLALIFFPSHFPLFSSLLSTCFSIPVHFCSFPPSLRFLSPFLPFCQLPFPVLSPCLFSTFVYIYFCLSHLSPSPSPSLLSPFLSSFPYSPFFSLFHLSSLVSFLLFPLSLSPFSPSLSSFSFSHFFLLSLFSSFPFLLKFPPKLSKGGRLAHHANP